LPRPTAEDSFGAKNNHHQSGRLRPVRTGRTISWIFSSRRTWFEQRTLRLLFGTINYLRVVVAGERCLGQGIALGGLTVTSHWMLDRGGWFPPPRTGLATNGDGSANSYHPAATRSIRGLSHSRFRDGSSSSDAPTGPCCIDRLYPRLGLFVAACLISGQGCGSAIHPVGTSGS